MSAEIPTDDPQAKDSAQEDSAQRDSAKNFPQNAPSPYMDEDLDEGPALDADTYPLISPIAASPQSQPDQYYPAMPNRQPQVSQFPANAKVTVSRQQPTARVNRVRVIGTKPNNYIECSIFNLFCCIFCGMWCCICFGVMALYYSLQVNAEYSAGRLRGSFAASRMAKIMNHVSLAIGGVTVANFVVYILIHVVNGKSLQ